MKSIYPKYQLLAQVLRQQIITGTLPVNAQLPTEDMLMQQFGYSRETVRKAVSVLEMEGLVNKIQGIGSFVNGPRPDAARFHFTEPAPSAEQAVKHFSYQLLQREILPAPMESAALLKIVPGTPVIHVIQLKLVDGTPQAVTERHLALSLCPALAEANLEQNPVHSILSLSAELAPVKAKLEIETRGLDEKESSWLKVKCGSPAIFINRMSYTAPNQPGVWYKGIFLNYYEMGIELEPISVTR